METSDVFSEQANAHPSEEVLERYAMSRSTDAECELVEEHILICAGCRNALDEADDWVRLMKAGLGEAKKPETERSPSAWSRLWNWNLGGFPGLPAMAGAVCALAMIVWIAGPRSRSTISEVSLSAVRGNDLRVEVPANAEVRLKLEQNSGGSDLNGNRVEIVDDRGTNTWTGVVRDASLTTPKLAKGGYWVRIFNLSGIQVKEYGLNAR